MSITAATPTALQPAFDLAHIVQHPGSTLAGIGLLATGASQALTLGTPSTAAGWIMLAMQLGASLLAMLGK